MEQNPEQFYDFLASRYDTMTRFRQRLEGETALLRRWWERYRFSTALDVGCGTGVHAIALARLGVSVTGVDTSAAMLERARLNAKASKVSVQWIQGEMQQLEKIVHQPFQAIFCLGNTLPHLTGTDELLHVFQQFRRILTPNGVLVIQLLNYQKILNERKRILSIRQVGNILFIRFYDFLEPHIRFNILTIQREGDSFQHNLHSTLLFPFHRAEVETGLKQAGFSRINFWGDMKFSPFSPEKSGNLVAAAHI